MNSVKIVVYSHNFISKKQRNTQKGSALSKTRVYFSLHISLNIFRSNKCVTSYATVDIDKCAETSVNVQVQFLLLLSEITY
jgi:hypothetical protein